MSIEAEAGRENSSGDSGYPAPFNLVNADPEEGRAASAEVRRLYHQLGYLDRGCLLPGQVQTNGKNVFVRWAKRGIGKACMFLLYPIVEAQNRINVQQANYLRGLLHQIDRLTEENLKLKEELTEIKEKLSL